MKKDKFNSINKVEIKKAFDTLKLSKNESNLIKGGDDTPPIPDPTDPNVIVQPCLCDGHCTMGPSCTKGWY